MRKALWVAPATIVGLMIVASAGRAAADITTTDGCTGSGTFRASGLSVDAGTIGKTVVVIPRSDTVDWKASVAAPPGVYSGSISIDLPPPFGEVQIDSWNGNSQTTSNAGAKSYNFPSLIPSDVEFQVRGSHTDENGYCTGFVNLKLAGGPFKSLLTPISLVATVVTGAGLLGTIRPLFRKVP